MNSAIIVRSVKLHISSLDDASLDKNLLKNFSYHISLLVTALKIGKGLFGEDDIVNIDINIDRKIIEEGIVKFLRYLNIYSDRTKENPINTAKSTVFDKELLINIKNDSYDK